jgi:predicted ATPase
MASRTMGSKLGEPYVLALLAEAYAQIGQTAKGVRLLVRAQSVMEQHEVRFWEAEIHRLKGELLQEATPDASQAEACFHRALAVARRQHAKSLELRTAMSLARLWQHQSKSQEAHDLLASVDGWFTEGFDTFDLQEAKAPLQTLR